MGKLMLKIITKEAAKNIWETQYRKFMTSRKANIVFCLPEFSTARIVTFRCHVDESNNSIYYMILGRDLLTSLGLDLKFSKNIISGGE